MEDRNIEPSNPLSHHHQEQCFICCGNSTTLVNISTITTNHLPTTAKFRNAKRCMLLESQLAVILFLRKVLGIPRDALVDILQAAGNPSTWDIQFCSSCLTVFREAEFVQRRLLKLQSDFEELANELRSLILKSVDVDAEVVVPTLPTPRKRRKKVGRPKRTKAVVPDAGMENLPLRERIRRKFVEGLNQELLDLNSPRTLYSISNTATILDGMLTTHPVSVKVPEKFYLPKVNHQESQTYDDDSVGDIPFRLASPSVTNLVKENSSVRSSIILKIKKVKVNGVSDYLSEESESEGQCQRSENPDGSVARIDNVHSLRDLSKTIKSEFKDCGTTGEYGDVNGETNFVTSSPEWAPDDNNDGDDGEPHVLESEWENLTDDGDSDFNPKPKSKRKSKSKSRKLMEARRKGKIYRDNLIASCEKFSGEELDAEPVMEADIYKCPKCDSLFHKKIECRIHTLREHFEDPLPYHCHICDSKRFSLEKSFRNHMYRFHIGAKCPYDDDYNPELHSAENLKSMVVKGSTWNSVSNEDRVDKGGCSISEENPTASSTIDPTLPDDILEKFKDNPHELHPCRQCKRKFPNRMLRDGHEKRMHQGVLNAFPCDLCHRAYPRRTRLLKHVVTVHYSGNQHVCSQCGSRFADKRLLEGHIRRTHLGETNPFECITCSRRFPRKTKLEAHMSKVHGFRSPRISRKKITAKMLTIPRIIQLPRPITNEDQEQEQLECWICSSDGVPLKFDSTEEKDQHIQITHTSVEKPYICPVDTCAKKYAVHGFLTHHIATVHKGCEIAVPPHQAKEHLCDECGSKFKTQSQLYNHLRTIHGNARFICDLCGKRFKMQTYLRDHQQQFHHKELNIQPHKCKFCGKILNTERSLSYHIKMVHTKQTRFKCKECDFGCMFETNLKRHIEVRHSKIAGAICPVCSRSFATQLYLDNHMRVHTGEKPFKCSQCGKKFSDNSTYRRHVESHAGRIHVCPLETCKKQYKTRHAFRVHIKIHQKKGVMVEIPKVRYVDDFIAGQQTKSTGAESCTRSTSSSFVDLPELKSEVDDVAQIINQETVSTSSVTQSQNYVDAQSLDSSALEEFKEDEPPVLHAQVSNEIFDLI